MKLFFFIPKRMRPVAQKCIQHEPLLGGLRDSRVIVSRKGFLDLCTLCRYKVALGISKNGSPDEVQHISISHEFAFSYYGKSGTFLRGVNALPFPIPAFPLQKS